MPCAAKADTQALWHFQLPCTITILTPSLIKPGLMSRPITLLTELQDTYDWHHDGRIYIGIKQASQLPTLHHRVGTSEERLGITTPRGSSGSLGCLRVTSCPAHCAYGDVRPQADRDDDPARRKFKAGVCVFPYDNQAWFRQRQHVRYLTLLIM